MAAVRRLEQTRRMAAERYERESAGSTGVHGVPPAGETAWVPNGLAVGTVRHTRTALVGRGQECARLDRLLADMRAGCSPVLVLRGAPGIGKNALLGYAANRGEGGRVVRAAGLESEMELPFAGLHQLCGPLLDGLARLPPPQRDALRTAFGLSSSGQPDSFLVGLAVLSLLSDAAAEAPLLCLVDDAQWLDRVSAQTLAFVARRLVAESVALVFAVREPSDAQELVGLAELVVSELRPGDARTLLDSAISGPMDDRVRDRIAAETRGNPLALLGLRGLTPEQLAGGFGLPDASVPVGHSVETWRRRLTPLPPATRLLLLVAAAEPGGDPVLVWRAADRLGVEFGAAEPATATGLVEFGEHVCFRHPIARSAIYRAASPVERQMVHRVLAEVTDPGVDPDRHVWHLAHATPGPDEGVANELEEAVGRVRARGGLAAAAAFHKHAAELTPEPARRAQRALAAAQAEHQAGALDAALPLLARAQAGPLDELGRAQVDVLRAQIAFASGGISDGPRQLLRAAQRLEPLNIGLACETYRDAFDATLAAGRLADHVGLREVAEAARAAPRALQPPRAPELALDGLAMLTTEGYAAGAPILRRALSAFRNTEASTEEALGWLPLACRAARDVWDDESWYTLSNRLIQLARDGGALAVLPLALLSGTSVQLMAGEFATAASMAEEAQAVAEATGRTVGPYGSLMVAAWSGREAEASRLVAGATGEMIARGEGQWLTATHWATAVLNNGLCRFHEALAAAELGSGYPEELGFSTWSMVELIEAAARTASLERATNVLGRLSEITSASGGDWALGIQARSGALLSKGEAAESLYREAIDRLSRTRIRVELARARLLYGEWLRRENRRVDAREELRVAYEMLTAMGIEKFAQRARRELLATGATVRKRSVETSDDLTPQETQIARLAVDGRTNPEIAGELFLSPRTVEWHLRKVFTKLGISSRRELRRVLPDPGRLTAPA